MRKVFGDQSPNVYKQLEDARAAFDRGRKKAAYETVGGLLREAADILRRRREKRAG